MAQTLHINFSKFDSTLEIADYFNTEAICKQAIAQERWGDGDVVCPYCGSTHCHMCKDGRYICKGCQRKFSVLVGTIFENTKISLRKWFVAMYIISCSKKGVSSCQLARDIKVTQKTAWFMMHKIRGLFGQSDSIALNGEVEMDEMYLGGREANKHESKKVAGTQGRSTKTKTPIFGMQQRNGKVVAMKVEDTKGATLMPIVSQFVESGSTTYTDEANIYHSLTKNGYVLADEGVDPGPLVLAHQVGVDALAARGQLVDDGQVQIPVEDQSQGPGNGSGGHDQHMGPPVPAALGGKGRPLVGILGAVPDIVVKHRHFGGIVADGDEGLGDGISLGSLDLEREPGSGAAGLEYLFI